MSNPSFSTEEISLICEGLSWLPDPPFPTKRLIQKLQVPHSLSPLIVSLTPQDPRRAWYEALDFPFAADNNFVSLTPREISLMIFVLSEQPQVEDLIQRLIAAL